MKKYIINKNYPHYYIYSDGRIFSKRTNQFLKTPLDRGGYVKVTLTYNGKRVYKTVHRLVAETFIPNPENKPQINHINGIKTDNRAENLEWCTVEENEIHAMRNGLKAVGLRNGKCKLSDQEVLEIRAKYKSGNITMEILGKEYGVCKSHISGIISHRFRSNVKEQLDKESVDFIDSLIEKLGKDNLIKWINQKY